MAGRSRSIKNMVVMTIKLPKELRDESREIALSKDVAVSQIVRKCLREFIKDSKIEIETETQKEIDQNSV